MSLTNCKVEWKHKWAKYYVLLAAGADNINSRDPNIYFFTIKDTKLYVPVAALSARDNQKLSKFLRKGFGRPVYMNKCKIKRHNKNTTNGFRYFIESDFAGANTLFVLVYTNHGDNVKKN